MTAAPPESDGIILDTITIELVLVNGKEEVHTSVAGHGTTLVTRLGMLAMAQDTLTQTENLTIDPEEG